MEDMGRVEEGNRLVLSGCLLLLRNIILIFNVYICISWGLESLMFKRIDSEKCDMKKLLKIRDVGLNVSHFLIVMEMKFTII